MILVVDDDKNIRLSLKLILERNEYEVTLAEGPKEAMQIVRSSRYRPVPAGAHQHRQKCRGEYRNDTRTYQS